MTQELPPHIREHVSLAPYTTLGLGGPARFFAACTTEREIVAAVTFARAHGMTAVVLGSGSNVIVRDEGYDGLVMHIATKGFALQRDGGELLLAASAGEPWDHIVEYSVQQGLTGLECLSGIPSSVGATPIQNVGAYGQEVSQTIVRVLALDLHSLKYNEFRTTDCRFGYRRSRFKEEDSRNFVIISVTFRLSDRQTPTVEYPELRKYIAVTYGKADLPPGHEGLRIVREAVLALRRKKSMLIDPSDPNSRSAGSFFTNPVVTQETAARMRQTWPDLPVYPLGESAKLPAAWLVEHAGFPRGYRRGGAAISDNHALALVNRGTTAAELLDFAAHIQDCVFEKFGIRLEREPVVLGE